MCVYGRRYQSWHGHMTGLVFSWSTYSEQNSILMISTVCCMYAKEKTWYNKESCIVVTISFGVSCCLFDLFSDFTSATYESCNKFSSLF